MTAHTPGPWKAVQKEEEWWDVETEDCTVRILFIDRRKDGHAGFKAATGADAYLIAAAPDLLTALEGTINHWIEDKPCWCPKKPDHDEPVIPHIVCLEARAAIAQAKGE